MGQGKNEKRNGSERERRKGKRKGNRSEKEERKRKKGKTRKEKIERGKRIQRMAMIELRWGNKKEMTMLEGLSMMRSATTVGVVTILEEMRRIRGTIKETIEGRTIERMTEVRETAEKKRIEERKLIGIRTGVKKVVGRRKVDVAAITNETSGPGTTGKKFLGKKKNQRQRKPQQLKRKNCRL